MTLKNLEYLTENFENFTWLDAIKKSLSDGQSKTANQIWDFIRTNDLVKTTAKDPLNNNIYPLLQRHTDNIDDKRKGDTFFTSSGNPRKFKLLEIKDTKDIKKNISVDLTEDNEKKNYSFIQAAQICLKNNNNKPLTASEIWNEISDLVTTKGDTPLATLRAVLNRASENTVYKRKRKSPIFKILVDNPENKYSLLDPTAETQNIPDEMEDEDFDDFDIKSFPYKSRLSNASQIEKELKIAQAQPEKTKSQEQAQAQGKRVKNPFGSALSQGNETSALCIIGKSGSGKSTTTENALEAMKHKYMIYIPIEGEYTFSQYNGQTFERTDFGDFILESQNNPETCYTVIFDECHRPITLSKLNADLLQALSSRRNRGNKRFLTMDRVTKKLYTNVNSPNFEFRIPLKEENGKVLVPENFGIVCLSSRADIICRNEDLINRMDMVVFKENQRDIKDLTRLEKLDNKDYNSVKSKLDENAK